MREKFGLVADFQNTINKNPGRGFLGAAFLNAPLQKKAEAMARVEDDPG